MESPLNSSASAQPIRPVSTFELLTMCGELIQAIDACTDWFVLSRWERDPVKRAAYEAIYEAKNKQYLEVLEEVHDKLTK